TAGLLPALGVTPVVGRPLRPEENLPGRGKVALIGHALWQRRFGGDPAVAGKTIELDGVTHEIAGVLPSGFQLLSPADVVLPIARAVLHAAGEAAARLLPTFAIAPRLSGPVLVFALAASAVAALATSAVAAAASRERDVVRLLKRGTSAPAHARMRGALVAAE